MIRLINPKYYVPVYGYPHMLIGNARNAQQMGYKKENIAILRNGKILEFTDGKMHETEQYVSHKLLTIDGKMVGYTGEPELHDRYQISQNGVIVVTISKKGKNYHIKYRTVGLPLVSKIPGLEKALNERIQPILKDLSRFKDEAAFIRYTEQKVGDTILHHTNKEPKVIVIAQ